LHLLPTPYPLFHALIREECVASQRERFIAKAVEALKKKTRQKCIIRLYPTAPDRPLERLAIDIERAIAADEDPEAEDLRETRTVLSARHLHQLIQQEECHDHLILMPEALDENRTELLLRWIKKSGNRGLLNFRQQRFYVVEDPPGKLVQNGLIFDLLPDSVPLIDPEDALRRARTHDWYSR
jgi:hypothetical protein